MTRSQFPPDPSSFGGAISGPIISRGLWSCAVCVPSGSLYTPGSVGRVKPSLATSPSSAGVRQGRFDRSSENEKSSGSVKTQ